MIFNLIVQIVFLPVLCQAFDEDRSSSLRSSENICYSGCSLSIVESIPVNLTYPNSSTKHQSTHKTWLQLIDSAKHSIEIASLYWSMKKEDVYPDSSAREGEEVFQALFEASKDRKIKLHIAQNAPSHLSPNTDTEYLAKKANAQVYKKFHQTIFLYYFFIKLKKY